MIVGRQASNCVINDNHQDVLNPRNKSKHFDMPLILLKAEFPLEKKFKPSRTGEIKLWRKTWDVCFARSWFLFQYDDCNSFWVSSCNTSYSWAKWMAVNHIDNSLSMWDHWHPRLFSCKAKYAEIILFLGWSMLTPYLPDVSHSDWTPCECGLWGGISQGLCWGWEVSWWIDDIH